MQALRDHAVGALALALAIGLGAIALPGLRDTGDTSVAIRAAQHVAAAAHDDAGRAQRELVELDRRAARIDARLRGGFDTAHDHQRAVDRAAAKRRRDELQRQQPELQARPVAEERARRLQGFVMPQACLDNPLCK